MTLVGLFDVDLIDLSANNFLFQAFHPGGRFLLSGCEDTSISLVTIFNYLAQ